MASEITRYVDVAITKETALVSAAGFGVPLLLTNDVVVINTTERTREYLSLAAVEVDFASTTDEYKAARAYFSQDPFSKTQPEKLIIGCWDEVGLETISDAYTALKDSNPDWYGIGIIEGLRTDLTNLEALSDLVEADRRVLILDSNNADDYDPAGVTDLLTVLNAKGTMGNRRTMVVYHDDTTKYPAWGITGRLFPINPGSSTMAYQILADASAGADFIDAADITEVNRDNLFAKYGNTIVTTAGQTFFYEGTMVGGKNIDREGEYFDIVRSIDYMQARVEEGLFSLLLERSQAGKKIPFTDDGIGLVYNRLSERLQQMVTDGILVDGTIVITVPKRSDVSTTDRDDRKLPDVDFTAELAGAIHKVVVRGKVRV